MISDRQIVVAQDMHELVHHSSKQVHEPFGPAALVGTEIPAARGKFRVVNVN